MSTVKHKWKPKNKNPSENNKRTEIKWRLADDIVSHTHTVVRECFKGDEASQWKRPKFDPSPHQKPLNRSSQKLAGVIASWMAPGTKNLVSIGLGFSAPQIRDAFPVINVKKTSSLKQSAAASQNTSHKQNSKNHKSTSPQSRRTPGRCVWLSVNIVHRVSKNRTRLLCFYNSCKNGTVSMIFDTSNCPSTFDTLPWK